MRAADTTVPEALARAARQWGPRTALVCARRGQAATFAELDELADRVAAGLRARGVGRGDHVAVMFRNDLEFPVSWLGVLRAGAAMVPLNVHLAGADLAPIVRAARPALVLAADELAGVLDEALDPGTPRCLFRTGSPALAALREELDALLPRGAEPAGPAEPAAGGRRAAPGAPPAPRSRCGTGSGRWRHRAPRPGRRRTPRRPGPRRAARRARWAPGRPRRGAR